jgi:acetyltransferase-like isoleucine patch superfamily enzyme
MSSLDMRTISSHALSGMAMLRTRVQYGWRFREMGDRCIIEKPYRILGLKYMKLGRGVRIKAGARLEALNPEGVSGRDAGLSIGDGVTIGQDCHIVCTDAITIGSGALLGARVSILDSDHEDASPGRSREMTGVRRAPVAIGERVWIGNGAVVTAGVSIGDGATSQRVIPLAACLLG